MSEGRKEVHGSVVLIVAGVLVLLLGGIAAGLMYATRVAREIQAGFDAQDQADREHFEEMRKAYGLGRGSANPGAAGPALEVPEPRPERASADPPGPSPVEPAPGAPDASAAADPATEAGFWIEGIVVAEDGRPLAGVELGAWREQAELDQQYSSQDGRFRLGPIEPGKYEVVAFAEGFVDAAGIEVPAGTRDLRIVLSRGALVFGRVRTSDGSELPGEVDVYVTPADDVTDGSSLDNAGAGSDGEFRVAGLPPGSYDVVASAAGWIDGSASFRVEGREEVGPLDLVLRRGGAIVGRVVGVGGLPFEDAALSVRRPDEENPLSVTIVGNLVGHGTFAYRSFDGTYATTDEEGGFEITGLEPGLVNVEVSHADAMPRKLEGVLVAEGKTTDLGDIILEPGGRIVVSVARASADEPMSVTVSAWRMDEGSGERIAKGRDQAEQALQGNLYKEPSLDLPLSGLSPGPWLIALSALRGPDEGVIDWSGWTNALRARVVVLRPGEEKRIEFVVEPGTALSGRLLQDGEPVPYAGVLLLHAGADWTAGYARLGTGDDGRFALDDVPPGEYRLAARAGEAGVPLGEWTIQVPAGLEELKVELVVEEPK